MQHSREIGYIIASYTQFCKKTLQIFSLALLPFVVSLEVIFEKESS